MIIRNIRKNKLKFIQPIVSNNYGGGRWDRIRMLRKMSFVTIAIMGLVFSMSGILAPKGVCSVFMDLDEEMKRIAQTAVRMYCVAFFSMGD